MTAILRKAAAVLLVALVLAPSAALASSPGSSTAAETGPTDIITGTIETRFPQRPPSAAAPLYKIRIAEVIKGDLQPGTTTVLTREPAFARCDAAELKPDRTRQYLFQLTADGAQLLAMRCDDVLAATPQLLRQIRQAVQAEEEAENPPQPPAEPEPVVYRDLGVDEARPFGRAAAPGLAIVIVGVLGLLLTGRLGRRRS